MVVCEDAGLFARIEIAWVLYVHGWSGVWKKGLFQERRGARRRS